MDWAAVNLQEHPGDARLLLLRLERKSFRTKSRSPAFNPAGHPHAERPHGCGFASRGHRLAPLPHNLDQLLATLVSCCSRAAWCGDTSGRESQGLGAAHASADPRACGQTRQRGVWYGHWGEDPVSSKDSFKCPRCGRKSEVCTADWHARTVILGQGKGSAMRTVQSFENQNPSLEHH